LPEPKKEYAQIDASKLDEEEKSIYDRLKENNGSMYQSDLIKQTGFTKVKMTRLLDKLESKGILERKRRGTTNIAVLK
ncbi:MarR family transcriptional regulator, partial [Candidatus Woesearchaeota archaeon]|nr:MarR family transcriptional regulator [Candidatus Woesearchaeota archaeon]